ncbi:MAG TPA: PLP-dependent aminotransferase family protein [Thermoplasmatales archaeon]|nr:PLP-dependent aminotransferase family protein [Thermoplasmata archaeon]HHH84093.1 PLP-dependent aminotransferase family protein [Thermoplasmatales archaeon]
MDIQELYSENVRKMKSSEIRELLEVSQQPGVISFGGGLPNTGAFPVGDIKKIVNDVLDEEGDIALQYGTTPGRKKLIEEIISMARKDDIKADIDNVIITVGSQQALDLLGRVFLNEGDTIFLGSPTYLGGINAFRSYGADMIGVPLDDDGMDVDKLEEKIKESRKEGKNLKMIYTIPTFQNPAGVVMSEERRKRIVEIAEENNLLLVEDDPYGKLRFDGKPLKPLKAYDENVVYLGTFSKILSPGFRLAYAIAPEEVTKKMVIAKQSIDLCTPTFTQSIAYRFIKEGYMDRHIPRIIKMYKRKRDLMLEALEEYFPEGCKWTHPHGGMFLWATLPEHIDTKEMFKDAIKEKVAYVHGRAFYVDGGGSNAMRLNFSNPSDEEITEGIKRLGKVIEKKL